MYTIGTNRLFFQANNLDGEPVEIEIVEPFLRKRPRQPMIYDGDGLYYYDVEFYEHGSHAMRVYHNGDKVGHGILPVGHTNGIVVKIRNSGHR